MTASLYPYLKPLSTSCTHLIILRSTTLHMNLSFTVPWFCLIPLTLPPALTLLSGTLLPPPRMHTHTHTHTHTQIRTRTSTHKHTCSLWSSDLTHWNSSCSGAPLGGGWMDTMRRNSSMAIGIRMDRREDSLRALTSITLPMASSSPGVQHAMRGVCEHACVRAGQHHIANGQQLTWHAACSVWRA